MSFLSSSPFEKEPDPSAYSASESAPDFTPHSSEGWFERTFDPTGFQANFNEAENQKDRDFSAAQASLDREFNHNEAELKYQRDLEMRNTAYQSAVSDMRAAGLNPYLAYSQGSASSLPASSASSSGARASSARGVSGGSNLGVLIELASIVTSAFKLGTASSYNSAAAKKLAAVEAFNSKSR